MNDALKQLLIETAIKAAIGAVVVLIVNKTYDAIVNRPKQVQ